MKYSTAVTGFILAVVLPAAPAAGADWPCYRKDARRSGVTPERILFPLQRRWLYPGPAPSPAWPLPGRAAPMLDFDHCNYPVIAGGLAYFASSADDTLYCLDLASGTRRWCFTADAPLRFAPHVADGRCYVAGDDGILYCLDAVTGREVWRFDGRPDDRMLVGNGRMIARWPCRTGVLVDGGIAYFACGMWPSAGVYYYAVDARTGERAWCNDTTSHQYRAFPHDGVSFGGPLPQGYLLAADGRLVVPSGQTSPAFFDVADGDFIRWNQKRPGSTWATVAGSRVVVSARGWVVDEQVRFGEAPIWASDGLAMFDVRSGKPDHGTWRAYNRLPTSARVAVKGHLRGQVDPIGGRYRCVADGSRWFFQGMGKLERVDMAGKKPACRWQVAHPRAWAMVLAGDALLVGTRDRVAAVDPADGSTIWSSAVDGQVRGIAVGGGAVLAATHRGAIYAFAPGSQGEPTTVAVPPREEPGGKSCVDGIVPAGAKGFALVVGEDAIVESLRLADFTRLSIICIAAGKESRAAARKTVRSRGYADRVTVHAAPGDGTLPYADYFANLVIVCGQRVPVRPGELYRILTPRTGKMVFHRIPREKVPAFLRDAGAEKETIRGSGATVYLCRGPLEGAFDWDSAVTADRRLRWPLELLWFGRPGRSRMTARHRQYRHPGTPIPAAGRYAAWGERHVICGDVYNGTELWTHEIPHPGTIAGDNEYIYVGTAGRILCFASGTGRLAEVYGTRPPAFLQSLEKPRRYTAEKGERYAGSIAVRKGPDGLVVRLEAKTPRPSAHDAWVLGFDFRPPAQRLLPWGKGAFPLVVDMNSTGLRRFDGFDRSIVIPPVAVRRGGAGGIELAVPFAEIKKLAGDIPDSFAMRARIALYEDNRQGSRIILNAMPFTDGRDLLGNGTMTFALKPGVAAENLPVNRLSCRPKKSAPDRARGNGVLPPVLRTDGNKGHDPLAPAHNDALGRRKNPLTGAEEKAVYVRGYGCCGAISSHTMDFMRSGTLGMYDLADDSGMRNFPGMKPGCRLSILPAMGVALSVEANADCYCPYSIATSLALAPAKARRNEDWALFYHPMTEGRIRRLHLNLGAPGDRRDTGGSVWLGYPRDKTMLKTGQCFGPVGHTFGLPVTVELLPGAEMLRVNTDRVRIAGTGTSWIGGSGIAGIEAVTLNMNYSEPRTTVCAVPADEPVTVDGALDEPAWKEMPGQPVNQRDNAGKVYLRFDRDNLYLGYARKAKTDGKDKPGPWREARADNIWHGSYFDAVLHDAKKPLVLHAGIGKGGHRYAAIKSFTVELPKLETVSTDGRDDEWAEAAKLLLPEDKGVIRLAWTGRGIAVLCELPQSFSLGPGRDALRLQFFDRPSAAVGELVILPAAGSARLVKPIIGKRRSSDFRDYEKTEPLTGDVHAGAEDGRVVIEALLPFASFRGREVADGFLGMAIIGYDPDSRDSNIAEGKAARRRLFHGPAVMGVRLSDKRFSRAYTANRRRREWFGAVVHFAPATRAIRDDAWQAAMTDSPRSLCAEIALPLGLLKEAGFSGRNMSIAFMNGGRLPDDPFGALRGEGCRRIYLKSTSAEGAGDCTVRLHFVELADAQPGDRVFDVIVQGKPVLKKFDIVREAGGIRRAITRKIEHVAAKDALTIEFRSVKSKLPPLVNGIEIRAE